MPGPAMSALLRVTTAVLALGERVAAGDKDAAAQVDAIAAVLAAAAPQPRQGR